MTAKEKAEELIAKFQRIRIFDDIEGGFPLDNRESIECAKIAVAEILKDIPDYLSNINPKRFYWQEVKQELEKM